MIPALIGTAQSDRYAYLKTPPTDVTVNTPASIIYTYTPIITWTDIPTGGIASYEGRVSIGSSPVTDWAAITNGGYQGGLALGDSTTYNMQIRGVDVNGNVGDLIGTSASDWTSISTISGGDGISAGMVNGVDATLYTTPSKYLCYIYNTALGAYVGVGIIWSGSAIVTSARIQTGYSAGDFTIYYGDVDQGACSSATASGMNSHPGYNASTGENDIGYMYASISFGSGAAAASFATNQSFITNNYSPSADTWLVSTPTTISAGSVLQEIPYNSSYKIVSDATCNLYWELGLSDGVFGAWSPCYAAGSDAVLADGDSKIIGIGVFAGTYSTKCDLFTDLTQAGAAYEWLSTNI